MGSYLLGSLGSLHMPRVRSQKRVTCLHQVHTYSTFTHCRPSRQPSPSTQTFPNRRPHSHVPCTHSHPPAPTLHIAPWELLSPTAPCAGCREGRTPGKEWGPGPGHPDGVLRTQPGCLELMGGAFTDGPTKGPDPKVPPSLFSPPPNPQPAPHAVGTPSARKGRRV